MKDKSEYVFIRSRAMINHGLTGNHTPAIKVKRHKSYRLKHYDYSSSGFYFVTIVTKDRVNYFGEIHDGKMSLSEIGEIVHRNWLNIPNQFQNVEIDEFIIMPNHLHGIITINNYSRSMINHGPTKRINHGPTERINHAPTDVDEKSAKHRNFSIPNNPMQKPHVSLGKVLRYCKAKSTYEIRENADIRFSWQSRYHDRIIRNQYEFIRIRNYIINNPENWEKDKENIRS